MNAYWAQLNERERWMVVIGGIVCGVLLFYMLLIAPLKQSVVEKKQQLLEKQDTLAWISQAQSQHQHKQSPKILSSSNLLTVLAQQLNASLFRQWPYQLQQNGVGDIELSFDAVPYNQWLNWLWSVRQTYQFSIQQLNVERTKLPGVVKLSIIIH
jgi:general secretion pathway protein M